MNWHESEMSAMLLDDFAEFAGHLTLDSGRRLELEPFQRTMLTDYFDGVPETLAILPKGNGKTTLLSALALFHVCTVGDAEVTIVAAARDQAGILLKQAAGFIRRSEGLRARLQVKQREVIHRDLGGRIRVIASDVDTADGLLPSLALVDELHRHRSPELYAVLRDGLMKRGGAMLTISTAGSDRDSVLWKTRQAAIERGAERTGCYLRAGGPDSPLILHEWSLVEGRDDPDDLDVVLTANPLSSVTLAQLRARHDSPSTTSWDWQRFACGIWASAEVPWLPDGAWEACCDHELEIPDGAPVWAGVDVGRRFDASAVVACTLIDGRIIVRSWVLESPGASGEQTDLGLVEAKIRELAGRYDVREVAFDPWSFERSAQLLADEGLPMVTFHQTNALMCPASARLLEAIKSRRLAHNGDPILAAHVYAGTTTEAGGGWRLTKRKSRSPNDALIALAMSLTRCEVGAGAKKGVGYVASGWDILHGAYDDDGEDIEKWAAAIAADERNRRVTT
jgi:phage terminase large subunit-like protein